MADHPPASPDRAAERAARRGTQSNPEGAPEEVRFSIEDLFENPRRLGEGVTRPAIAGALHGSDQATFTLEEAADLVNEFLKRPAAGQPTGRDVDIAGVAS